MAIVAKKLLRPSLRGLTKKHKVIVATVGPSGVCLSGGYWDGGSVSTYKEIDLRSCLYFGLTYPTDPPQFGGGKPPYVHPARGRAILKGGTFCGKPSAPSFYLNEDDLPLLFGLEKVLPDAPLGVLLDYLADHDREEERSLLMACRSSY